MALTKYKYVSDDGTNGFIKLDPVNFPAGITASVLGLEAATATDRFPIQWNTTPRKVAIHARIVRVRVKATNKRYTYPVGTAEAYGAIDPGAANEITLKRGEIVNL
jgi:uncharacterized MAPEG superfamily protein